MARYNYSAKGFNKEHSAMAVGISLSISTKQSIEICNFIRKKPLQRAKTMLNDVIAKKISVPFKRFSAVSHRKGKIAAGRYPVNASKEILGLLESVEANAQFKGLNTANLVISHICAQQANRPMHYGRQRGRKMKRTHVEVIVEEKALKKEIKTEPAKEKKKPAAQKEEKVKEKRKIVEKKEESKGEVKK